MFFRKKEKQKIEKNENTPDFILPLYLNQRFVYDILAIKNNGFTEFFEITDKSENNDNVKSKVNAGFGNNNEFSLIQANMSGEIESYSNTSSNNEKSYKKTHTPSSLFMQVYQYLIINKKVKKMEKDEDIDNVTSGDFVELKSNIELNTIVDFFETFDKVIDITEAFSSFAMLDSKRNFAKSPLFNLKKPVENTLKALVNEENNIKYGICKLENKDLVIKLNKNFFINSDYSEIKNGRFRIIGKVLEIIPEGQDILLNRENAVGLYDPQLFNNVKEAMRNIPNLKFKEFVDVVKGKTIVIMPIAIGI